MPLVWDDYTTLYALTVFESRDYGQVLNLVK
jgi:hypothetical protein